MRRAALYSILRLAIRPLAFVGIYGAASIISVNLTVRCIIPAHQSQFVWAQVSLERIGHALDKYRADCGAYPNLKLGLNALVTNPGINHWNGPYINTPPIDPWGRPYLYEISNSIPIARCLGADGKPGGNLYDGDITSLNPWAPLYESRWHAAWRVIAWRISPWLLLGVSLYAWFRTPTLRIQRALMNPHSSGTLVP